MVIMPPEQKRSSSHRGPEKPGRAGFSTCILVLIVANVIAVILESVEGLYIPHATFFQAFDIFSVAVFTVEYLLRLWTCTANPDYANPVLGRLRYAATPLAIIDLLAILPFFLPMFIPLDLRIMRALRLLRVFRILKISRYSYALKLLGRVMKAQVHVIGVLIFILVLLVVITSSLMFFVEHDVQPDDFANIPPPCGGPSPLSTVGYGDVFRLRPSARHSGLIALLVSVCSPSRPACSPRPSLPRSEQIILPSPVAGGGCRPPRTTGLLREEGSTDEKWKSRSRGCLGMWDSGAFSAEISRETAPVWRVEVLALFIMPPGSGAAEGASPSPLPRVILTTAHCPGEPGMLRVHHPG